MSRILLSGLFVLAIAAEATAQSAPATSSKASTTKTSRTATAQPAGSATRKTTTRNAGAATTGSTTRRDIGPAGNGAVGSTANADNKGENVYAAPGMPVNVDNPKKVEGYNGAAPSTQARTKKSTTLTPR